VRVRKLCRRLAIVGICAVVYEWFVVEAVGSELLAAVLVGFIVLLVHERLVRVAPPDVRTSLGFVGPFIHRVLPGIARESFDLLVPTLWRSFVSGEKLRGRWIALRYDYTDRSAADERGRRTIVVAGSNLTPNALPLDVNIAAGRLILHQLVPQHEAAASDPRYPM
jgi:hypothetical protein